MGGGGSSKMNFSDILKKSLYKENIQVIFFTLNYGSKGILMQILT